MVYDPSYRCVLSLLGLLLTGTDVLTIINHENDDHPVVKTSVAVNNSPTQDCNEHSLHFLEII